MLVLFVILLVREEIQDTSFLVNCGRRMLPLGFGGKGMVASYHGKELVAQLVSGFLDALASLDFTLVSQ